MTEELTLRLQKIQLLVMDLDGVLTDGKIIYGDHGDELKSFDIQDGLGLVLLRQNGVRSAIISGKKSKVNERRAKELKVYKICQNITDKSKALAKLIKSLGITEDEVCFIGDDLLDMPAMKLAGVAVAVSNARDDVKAISDYVTHNHGGDGAVREVVDLILKAQGKWPLLTQRMLAN